MNDLDEANMQRAQANGQKYKQTSCKNARHTISRMCRHFVEWLIIATHTHTKTSNVIYVLDKAFFLFGCQSQNGLLIEVEWIGCAREFD